MRTSLYAEEQGQQELPRVYTVAGLRQVLSDLPANLPLNGNQGLKPVWFNIGIAEQGINGEHLRLCETDEWDE